MGITLRLTSIGETVPNNIPAFSFGYASLNGIRRDLMETFGFAFVTRDHMLRIQAYSDDDILWHFFTAGDTEATFTSQECQHLTKQFRGLHTERHDQHFQELKYSLQIADQRGCSLSWQ